MAEIISLKSYRSKRKKQYLELYRNCIDEFIYVFIHRNFLSNFDYIYSAYLNEQVRQNEQAWDYYDFREVLNEAIAEVFGQQLWSETKAQRWFDPTFIEKEEMVDRCLSLFVMGAAVSGIS